MLNFCGVFDRITTASVAKTLQSSPTTCPPAGFLGLDSSILGSFGSSSSSATQKATSAVQRRSPMGRSAWWVQKAGVRWLTMIIHKEKHYDYDYDIPIYIVWTYILYITSYLLGHGKCPYVPPTNALGTNQSARAGKLWTWVNFAKPADENCLEGSSDRVQIP